MKMSNKEEPLIITAAKDYRYLRMSVAELKQMRANMLRHGGYNKYQFALVQYYIMKKENRLPNGIY